MAESKLGKDSVNIDRFEDKFIVNKAHLNEVLTRVMSQLKPAYPDKTTKFTLVESIYFDSQNLDFLRQHLEHEDTRTKLRIRTYGPDGQWEHDHYLEDKAKSNGRSTKQRVHLDDSLKDYVEEYSKLPVNNHLRNVNKSLDNEDFKNKTDLLNYLMSSHKVSPVIKLTYKRLAFEKGKLRVTIDQDLRVRPLRHFTPEDALKWKNDPLWDDLQEYGEKFYNGDNFVLEIKHDADYPPWIKQMLDDLKLETTHFSKYVWGFANLFKQVLRLYKK